MKAVVDHADGTRETFVTDGTWKVSKAAEFTTATVTTRNGDSGDKAERYDARNEQPGWDKAGFDDSAWQPAYAIGPTRARSTRSARPSATSTRRSRSSTTRRSTRSRSPSSPTAASSRTSARSLERPAARLHNGVAGRALVMQTSYRLNNTTLRRRGPRGDSDDQGRRASNFVAGDKITVDQAANGFGKGDPETRTITAVGTAGATGRDHARRAAEPRARQRPLRRGLARRHQHPRHAGLQPRLVVHREGRRPDRPGRTSTGAGATCRSSRRARARTSAPTTSPPSSSTRARPPTARRRSTPTTRRSTRSSTDAALGDRLLAGDVPGHAHAREGPVHRRLGRHLLRDDGLRRRPHRDRPRDPRDRRVRQPRVEGRRERLLHRRPAPVLVREPRHPGPRELRLSQRRQHARHPGLHGVRPRVDLALLPAERRQGDAGRELQPAQGDRRLPEHQHADHRQRLRPDLQPVRRHQLLPVRDHRLAVADALRLHVHQQRRAHDPQRARPSARCAPWRRRPPRSGNPDDARGTPAGRPRSRRR